MDLSLELGAFGVKARFAFSSKDIPVCTTRPMRGMSGMPWNRRVGVHPLPDGRIEVTPIARPALPPGPEEAE